MHPNFLSLAKKKSTDPLSFFNSGTRASPEDTGKGAIFFRMGGGGGRNVSLEGIHASFAFGIQAVRPDSGIFIPALLPTLWY